MLQCPFCHFDNEDGALFCEQCKSDLAGVQPAAPIAGSVESVPVVAFPAAPPPEAIVPAVPLAETVPVEAVSPLPAPGDIPMAAVVLPETGSFLAPTAPAAADQAPTDEFPSASSSAPVPAAPGAPPVAPAAREPRLVVLRGLKRSIEYPIYEGDNFIGRADEKPVDIDLDDQESPDRVWASRQHALVSYQDGKVFIEDLNSSNGTFVNRARIYPGQRRELAPGDVIQCGTVQMKLVT